jgi:hypothetical protein
MDDGRLPMAIVLERAIKPSVFGKFKELEERVNPNVIGETRNRSNFNHRNQKLKIIT